MLYKIRPCLLDDLQQVLDLSQQWANENITIGYENVHHTLEKLANFINEVFRYAE